MAGLQREANVNSLTCMMKFESNAFDEGALRLASVHMV